MPLVAVVSSARSRLKLALITNGSIRMQSRKLQCLPAPLFDTILICDAQASSKPESPNFFHRALERPTPSPVSLFVVTSPDVDLAGARSAGMQFIFVENHGVHASRTSGIIVELCDLLTCAGVGTKRLGE